MLCGFHRGQAWDRWLSTGENGCTSVKGKIMEMLRHIADAGTAELFQEKLEKLKNSEYWMNHPKLAKYITDHYLSIKEVFFFCSNDICLRFITFDYSLLV